MRRCWTHWLAQSIRAQFLRIMTARATTRTLVSRPQSFFGSLSPDARFTFLLPSGLGRLAAHRPATSSWRHGLEAAMVALAGLMPLASAHAYARGEAAQAGADSALQAVVPLSILPRQARETHERILAGGPFDHAKDGTVFGNRERLLPRQKRGYYREYTVRTPGVRHRGARRIVCGGAVVQRPETCFYTQDHYQSFQKIDPSR